MIRRLLKRWADAALEKRLTKIESDLDATRRSLAVTEGERDNLAAVIARDRQRIKAEGAAYARQQAESEGVSSEQRTEQSIRRFGT